MESAPTLPKAMPPDPSIPNNSTDDSPPRTIAATLWRIHQVYGVIGIVAVIFGSVAWVMLERNERRADQLIQTQKEAATELVHTQKEAANANLQVVVASTNAIRETGTAISEVGDAVDKVGQAVEASGEAVKEIARDVRELREEIKRAE